MTLYPVANTTPFHRDYYRDTKNKNLYCKEENTWYYCGRSTEPNWALPDKTVESIILE